jgi:L-lysine 6-transaminase
VTPEVERDTLAAEERALAEIEQAFANNPDDVAAILIEPIQAEGGDIHFRPEFLRALQRKAREHEVFFILDEVQTGVGITGRMWAHEHFGLEPDAVAFGKKMQVCGCMVGPRVDEEPENVFKVSSRINSTWGGGLTDMVRAQRFLEVIHEDGLLANARVIGERLLRGLQAVERESGGAIANARGLGLMIAFDLETPERRDRAKQRMFANGLLLLGCGTRSIRFRPPLNLTAAEADTALDLVSKSLKEL